MSEEIAEPQSEPNVSHETNDNQQADVDAPYSKSHPGHDPVDLDTATPAQIKARMDYFFKQDKERGRQLNEYRTIAEQQARAIDDLMNGVGQVVDHLQSEKIGANEDQIRNSMMAAWESGDVKKYHSEQERLVEVKAQREAQKLLQKQEKPQQNKPQTYSNSAAQLANEAAQDGDISPEQVKAVSAWQSETDDSGAALRPWAVNNSSDPEDPDPDFIKANLIALRVFKQNPHRTVEQNLSEVDRQMGVKQTNGKQNVMGGRLTTPPKQNRITLSPELQKLAVSTKFGGSKAKSDQDHIDAYRKQIEKVQSSKRSR